MKRFAGDRDPQPFSTDELEVAAELHAYSARLAPEPSAAFVDRMIVATELLPLPITARGPHTQAVQMAGATTRRIRMAFGQVAGGSRIPLKVRAQAGAMLLVVALVISAGAALAAAGAATVFAWVTGPQATTFASQTSGSPGLGTDQQASDRQRTDGSHPSDSGGRASASPNNCGNGVGGGNGVGTGGGVGIGIDCGNKTSDPNGKPTSSANNCGNGVGGGNGVGTGGGVGIGIDCGNKTSDPSNQPTDKPDKTNGNDKTPKPKATK